MLSSHLIGHVALVGIGATAVMDAWLVLLSRLGVPTTSFAMVGRWVGHIARGQFAHAAIAKAPPVRNELGLGWLTHYVIGIAYAALLVAAQGSAWLGSSSNAGLRHSVKRPRNQGAKNYTAQGQPHFDFAAVPTSMRDLNFVDVCSSHLGPAGSGRERDAAHLESCR